MGSNREVVAEAFAAWSRGDGHVSRLFTEGMTWEIVGRSKAAGTYGSAREFTDEVLRPFAARFRPDAPFRPVRVRRIHADGDTVVVVWDGEGTTTAGTPYRNTYAWFLTLRDGAVVDGTAFYDSIAFDELWDGVSPDGAVPPAAGG
ncbi:nuclear transport factor 2 family protein [Geodermatophilus sp. SYSU D00703]